MVFIIDSVRDMQSASFKTGLFAQLNEASGLFLCAVDRITPLIHDDTSFISDASFP